MSIAQKSVLVAGLGRFGPSASASANREKVSADVKRAKDHGFDCSDVEVNPKDANGSLEMVKGNVEKSGVGLFRDWVWHSRAEGVHRAV